MKPKLFLIVLLCVLSCALTFAQTQKQRAEISKGYDKQKLIDLSKQYSTHWNKSNNRAIEYAKANNLPISYTKDETYFHVSYLDNEQNLIYTQTHGTTANKNARADYLHQGGGLGLDLQGEGITAYIWDGGTARETHEGYTNNSNNSRYEAIQGALGSHASHVTGIIICNDTNPAAKGVAPAAYAKGYEFNNDIAEAANEAANGMLISNHSYGHANSTLADATFGQYNYEAQSWDKLLYLAPYYTMVTSAGNSGNDDTSNAKPLDNNSAFDKLSAAKCAKNTIVVANSANATLDANGDLISVNKSSGSSEGPTDDYRIKPDISGFGHGVLSTNAASDDHYSVKYGTSMACPTVTGSLLLLQQHYHNINSKYLRAATLKGLALHTADDFEDVGPDANVGWGLINAKTAAETITGNGNSSKILELTLNQGQTISLNVKSDALSPLLSSISWTDPEGAIKTSTNNNTAILVNDLDIRVTKNTDTHLPWKLLSVNTNTKGDNTVDPFERVDIDNATGEYTITITHKGTLKYGKQDFSLIVTGIDQSFSVINKNTDLDFCKNTADPIFNFDFKQFGTAPVQLSTINLPAGITSNLSTSTISNDGSFNVTLNNTNTLTSGAHSFSISATDGTDTFTTPLSFYIYDSDFSNTPIILNNPSNGNNAQGITTTLEWDENVNATEYIYYLSTNAKFTNLIANEVTKSNSIQIRNLIPEQVYYWKIEPKNNCTTLTDVPIFSFQVGEEDCNNSYTNNTVKPINNTQDNSGFGFGNGFTLSAISISDNAIITKATVDLDITHTNTQELQIILNNNYGPDHPDNRVISLSQFNCANGNNIDVTYSDDGANLICETSAPAISGVIKPTNPLSQLIGNNISSYWYLYTLDNVNGNNGTLNSYTLNFCVSKPIPSTLNLENNTINVDSNSTSIIENTELKINNPDNNTFTITGLPLKGDLLKNGTILVLGDTFTQTDINNSLISLQNTETETTTDEFKLDVFNEDTSEWLPNQAIAINITNTLNTNSFDSPISHLYPNPTSGKFTIKLKMPTLKESKIDMYDVQGRIVYSQNIAKGEQTLQIKPTSLNSGVYFVNMTINNSNIIQKIIIQ